MLYHEIIALYEQRNLQAITQSEQQFGAYCRLIARSLLRNEQDVDACVSDTWTRAWETVPLESPANLKLHIGKLTRSLAMERLAECAPDEYGEQVSAVLAELGEIASPNAHPSAAIAPQSLSAILGEFLSGLSARDCAIFIRRYYYVEDIELIARRFAVSRAEAEKILKTTRQGLHQAIGRIVCLQEIVLLGALGEIEPILIERAERYKPKRRFKLRTWHVVVSAALMLLTFWLLIVALIGGLVFAVCHTDALLQQSYGDYDGTIYDAMDIILTRDENFVSNMISEQHKESLHGYIERIKPDRGAIFVLHGSEALKYVSLKDGTCAVRGSYSCKDSHVLIPSVSPNGEVVGSIASDAFEDTPYVTEVTIPSTVTNIKQGAFKNSVKLTKVYMPESIEVIGDEAFAYCPSLTSLYIPTHVSQIGAGVFVGCTQLQSVTVSALNPNFYSESNCLISTEGQVLVTGWGEEIVIPDGVTSIRDDAFQNHKTLKKITFPQSVTTIGKGAFENCHSIESLLLPERLNGIGVSAFKNCAILAEIVIPSTVTVIEQGAFEGCYRLKTVYYTGSEESWEELMRTVEDDSPLKRATVYYEYDPAAAE